MCAKKNASKSAPKYNETVRLELAWVEARNGSGPGRTVALPRGEGADREFVRQRAFVNVGVSNLTAKLLASCKAGESNVKVLTEKQAVSIKDDLVKVGKLFRNSGEEFADYLATGAFTMARDVGRIIWLAGQGKLAGNVEFRLIATKKQLS